MTFLVMRYWYYSYNKGGDFIAGTMFYADTIDNSTLLSKVSTLVLGVIEEIGIQLKCLFLFKIYNYIF